MADPSPPDTSDPGVQPPVTAPDPQAGPPPQPMGVGVLRVQKERYNEWIAAGGTPPIYT